MNLAQSEDGKRQEEGEQIETTKGTPRELPVWMLIANQIPLRQWDVTSWGCCCTDKFITENEGTNVKGNNWTSSRPVPEGQN